MKPFPHALGLPGVPASFLPWNCPQAAWAAGGFDMKSETQRFWEKVTIQANGCWTWNGRLSGGGYGQFKTGGKYRAAHRYAYETTVLTIKGGLTLDHICRNRSCVNPLHLEPVTQRENILRGISFAASNAKKTHCPKGHDLSGGNLRFHNGKRHCRKCHAERNRRQRELTRMRSHLSLPQGLCPNKNQSHSRHMTIT